MAFPSCWIPAREIAFGGVGWLQLVFHQLERDIVHMGFFQAVVGLDDVIIDDVPFLGEDKQLHKVLGITGEGPAEHLTYAIRGLTKRLGILQRPRFVA